MKAIITLAGVVIAGVLIYGLVILPFEDMREVRENLGVRAVRATDPNPQTQTVVRYAPPQRAPLPNWAPKFVRFNTCIGDQVPEKTTSIPAKWNIKADWSSLVVRTWYRNGTGWVEDAKGPNGKSPVTLNQSYDAVAYCLKPAAKDRYGNERMPVSWYPRI